MKGQRTGFSELRSLMAEVEAQPTWQARRQFSQVAEYWPKAVGYRVARQTKPASIKHHVLYVTVANASWSQTLTLERRRILHKLNRLISTPLDDIRFSSAQWHTKPVRPPAVVTDWIKAHPSYIGVNNPPPTVAQPSDQPSTPESAYTAWAAAKQHQQKHQETCPTCHCACPPGEIARWTMCALCIVKTWK